MPPIERMAGSSREWGGPRLAARPRPRIPGRGSESTWVLCPVGLHDSV